MGKFKFLKNLHLSDRLCKKSVLAAYIVLFILTFSYLARIGYTTSDDVQIAQQGFVEAFHVAVQAGRLTWLVALPSTILSETQGSLWFAKILRIIWVVTLFHSSYLLLRAKLTPDKSLFVLLFPIIFFINNWDHHAFGAYPGLALYGLSCFFYSIYFLNKYLLQGRQKYQALSCAFFFASFVSELFPTLFIFLLIYPTGPLKNRLKALVPHFFAGLVFYYLYTQFKSEAPTHQLGFNLQAIKTWMIYSYSQIYDLRDVSVAALRELKLTFHFKYIASLLCILYIFVKSFEDKESAKSSNLVGFILWWVLISAFINIPVALTYTYQEWVSRGSRGYLYSAISNYSASISLGLLTMVVLTKYKNLLLRFIALVIILYIYSSHTIASYHIYHQQMYSHNRWNYMDGLARKQYFKPNYCYLAPWLFEINGLVIIRTDDYWDKYLLKNWGLKARIIKNPQSVDCEAVIVLDDLRSKP